jgi:hypothetical protein
MLLMKVRERLWVDCDDGPLTNEKKQGGEGRGTEKQEGRSDDGKEKGRDRDRFVKVAVPTSKRS